MHDPEQMCMEGSYIVADAAFPLMPTVITPFSQSSTDPGHLDFSKINSSTRIKIEHAFGALTMRWRTMWKHLDMLDVI